MFDERDDSNIDKDDELIQSTRWYDRCRPTKIITKSTKARILKKKIKKFY